MFKVFTDADIYVSETIQPYNLLLEREFIMLSVRRVSILVTLACSCATQLISSADKVIIEVLKFIAVQVTKPCAAKDGYYRDYII